MASVVEELLRGCAGLAELEQAGITIEDVDDSIERLLERLDRPDAENDEAQQAPSDDGYDPEADDATRKPEAVS